MASHLMALATLVLMWKHQLSFWSSITPKYIILWEGFISAPPILIFLTLGSTLLWKLYLLEKEEKKNSFFFFFFFFFFFCYGVSAYMAFNGLPWHNTFYDLHRVLAVNHWTNWKVLHHFKMYDILYFCLVFGYILDSLWLSIILVCIKNWIYSVCFFNNMPLWNNN